MCSITPANDPARQWCPNDNGEVAASYSSHSRSSTGAGGGGDDDDGDAVMLRCAECGWGVGASCRYGVQ